MNLNRLQLKYITHKTKQLVQPVYQPEECGLKDLFLLEKEAFTKFALNNEGSDIMLCAGYNKIGKTHAFRELVKAQLNHFSYIDLSCTLPEADQIQPSKCLILDEAGAIQEMLIKLELIKSIRERFKKVIFVLPSLLNTPEEGVELLHQLIPNSENAVKHIIPLKFCNQKQRVELIMAKINADPIIQLEVNSYEDLLAESAYKITNVLPEPFHVADSVAAVGDYINRIIRSIISYSKDLNVLNELVRGGFPTPSDIRMHVNNDIPYRSQELLWHPNYTNCNKDLNINRLISGQIQKLTHIYQKLAQRIIRGLN